MERYVLCACIPSQLNGPLIAERKNEGLPLTGDKLCLHMRKIPLSCKNSMEMEITNLQRALEGFEYLE